MRERTMKQQKRMIETQKENEGMKNKMTTKNDEKKKEEW